MQVRGINFTSSIAIIMTEEGTAPEAASPFAKALLRACKQVLRRGVDRKCQAFDDELARIMHHAIVFAPASRGRARASLVRGRISSEGAAA